MVPRKPRTVRSLVFWIESETKQNFGSASDVWTLENRKGCHCSQFATENRKKNNATMEYQIVHPPSEHYPPLTLNNGNILLYESSPFPSYLKIFVSIWTDLYFLEFYLRFSGSIHRVPTSTNNLLSWLLGMISFRTPKWRIWSKIGKRNWSSWIRNLLWAKPWR